MKISFLTKLETTQALLQTLKAKLYNKKEVTMYGT